MVETRTAEMRGASLILAQRILRGGDVLVTADVLVAAHRRRAGLPASRTGCARSLSAVRRRPLSGLNPAWCLKG